MLLVAEDEKSPTSLNVLCVKYKIIKCSVSISLQKHHLKLISGFTLNSLSKLSKWTDIIIEDWFD